METMKQAGGRPSGQSHYVKLALMIALMFLAMFALMYAMVDRFDNVYVNLNQFYMAGVMTGAMVLIELAIMGGMYPNKKANAAILAVSAVVLVACWFGIREQSAIGDRQFLRSMIPHHAGAILMCEEAPLRDPGIRELCAGILSSQRDEIRQMETLLEVDSRAK